MGLNRNPVRNERHRKLVGLSTRRTGPMVEGSSLRISIRLVRGVGTREDRSGVNFVINVPEEVGCEMLMINVD